MKKYFWQNLRLKSRALALRLRWPIIGCAGACVMISIAVWQAPQQIAKKETVDPFRGLQEQIAIDVQDRSKRYVADLIPAGDNGRSDYDYAIHTLVNVGYEEGNTEVVVKNVRIDITLFGPLLTPKFPDRLEKYVQRRFRADGFEKWLTGDKPVLAMEFFHQPSRSGWPSQKWFALSIAIAAALLALAMMIHLWQLIRRKPQILWSRDKALYRMLLHESYLFTDRDPVAIDLEEGTCHVDALRFGEREKLSEKVMRMPAPQAYTLLERLDRSTRRKVLEQAKLSPLIRKVLQSQF